MSSSFRFDPAASMSDSVRRAACGELEAAYASLASPPDRHRGVHEARKSLKRLRSLLQLVRPGLPEPVYGSLSGKLRGIARGLAPARDAHALLDALNKLDPKEAPEAAEAIAGVRDWLQRRRQAAERSLEGNTAGDAMRRLFALKPAFSSLAVYPDNFAPIAEGLRNAYRGARRAFARAFESGVDDDFHEWRKTVQRHWRHMQLLLPCWPSELSARVELSRGLSQTLGDDHDLAMLQHLVSAPTMAFARPDEVAAFMKHCRRRQQSLRQDAKMRGERLFAERPRIFVERIEAYWLSASQKGESKPPLRSANVIAFGDLGGSGRARASG